MKKIIIITSVVLLTSVACAKKTATSSSSGAEPKSGTMTSGPASETNSAPAQARDLAGTWIVTQGGDTWELVVTRTGTGTYSGSSTLVATNDPNGIYGPPGSKGDDIVIISDSPGTFRVRWAKAENFHQAEFWDGTGTYDDSSFDFAGAYRGKRKS